MPGDMAGQVLAIAVPTVIAFGFRKQTGLLAKIRHHAVGFERKQIRGVNILRPFERATRQAHSGKRKRLGSIGNGVDDRRGSQSAGHNE